jgi:condensin-2 complex subunit D3
VRNNILFVMRDLCVKYTSLVDKYVQCMADCFRDPSELVRKQSLVMVMQLLQQGFIKWRQALLMRFVYTLVDSSADVRRFAEFVTLHLVQAKQPDLPLRHFVEIVCHLNGYLPQHDANAAAHSGSDPRSVSAVGGPVGSRTVRHELFNLRGGGENERARMNVYRALLSTMTDLQVCIPCLTPLCIPCLTLSTSSPP